MTTKIEERPTRNVNTDQLNHYRRKLAFETDSWDLHEMLSRNEPVVVVDGTPRIGRDRNGHRAWLIPTRRPLAE